MKKTMIVCFAAALTMGAALAQDKMDKMDKTQDHDKMSGAKDAKKKMSNKKKSGKMDKMDHKDDGGKMDKM